MRAGLLDERIEVYEQSVTRDTFGGATEAWALVATRWGELKTLGGREAWRGAAPSSEATHQITVREGLGLTPRHQLRIGSRVFHIESVIDDSVCAVKEVV